VRETLRRSPLGLLSSGSRREGAAGQCERPDNQRNPTGRTFSALARSDLRRFWPALAPPSDCCCCDGGGGGGRASGFDARETVLARSFCALVLRRASRRAGARGGQPAQVARQRTGRSDRATHWRFMSLAERPMSAGCCEGVRIKGNERGSSKGAVDVGAATQAQHPPRVVAMPPGGRMGQTLTSICPGSPTCRTGARQASSDVRLPESFCLTCQLPSRRCCPAGRPVRSCGRPPSSTSDGALSAVEHLPGPPCMPPPLSSDALLALPEFKAALSPQSLVAAGLPALPDLPPELYDQARTHTSWYGHRGDGFFVGSSRSAGYSVGESESCSDSSAVEVRSEFERFEVSTSWDAPSARRVLPAETGPLSVPRRRHLVDLLGPPHLRAVSRPLRRDHDGTSRRWVRFELEPLLDNIEARPVPRFPLRCRSSRARSRPTRRSPSSRMLMACRASCASMARPRR